MDTEPTVQAFADDEFEYCAVAQFEFLGLRHHRLDDGLAL